MSEPKQARRFFISGSVQGVGFRYFALHAAVRFQVTGYARNLRDGRVEVYAIGNAAQLVAFQKVLKMGPYGASVMNVLEEAAALEEQHAREFSIITNV